MSEIFFSLLKSLRLLTIITLGVFVGIQNAEAEDAGNPICKSADVLSAKLMTDFCWSCILPIKLLGVEIGSDIPAPEGAADNPFCFCFDDLGVPEPGVATSMWQPARMVEFQRTPGCSSVLNGTQFPADTLFRGTVGTGDKDGSDGSFYHYNYYAFPLLVMMDLYVPYGCTSDGIMDLDLMYMSQLDPTWNNDDLAFFANPESAAVANPMAVLACSAEATTATVAKKTIDSMFWCAGSWGGLYPLSGNNNGGHGVIRDTSLLKTRALAALHRRGLAWQTMGEDAMCGGFINPMLPKSQYKFSLFYPLPEADSDHVIGESTMRWGIGKTIPGIAYDPAIYTIFRWADCCVR